MRLRQPACPGHGRGVAAFPLRADGAAGGGGRHDGGAVHHPAAPRHAGGPGPALSRRGGGSRDPARGRRAGGPWRHPRPDARRRAGGGHDLRHHRAARAGGWHDGDCCLGRVGLPPVTGVFTRAAGGGLPGRTGRGHRDADGGGADMGNHRARHGACPAQPGWPARRCVCHQPVEGQGTVHWRGADRDRRDMDGAAHGPPAAGQRARPAGTHAGRHTCRPHRNRPFPPRHARRRRYRAGGGRGAVFRIRASLRACPVRTRGRDRGACVLRRCRAVRGGGVWVHGGAGGIFVIPHFRRHYPGRDVPVLRICHAAAAGAVRGGGRAAFRHRLLPVCPDRHHGIGRDRQ